MEGRCRSTERDHEFIVCVHMHVCDGRLNDRGRKNQVRPYMVRGVSLKVEKWGP